MPAVKQAFCDHAIGSTGYNAEARCHAARCEVRVVAEGRSAWHRRVADETPAEYPPVTLILASRPNVYSSSPLDRIAARREDHAWIEQQLGHPDSLFVPVWRSRNLVSVTDGGDPEAVYISGEAATVMRMQGGPWAFLGLLDDRAVFAIDISAADDPVPLLPNRSANSSTSARWAGASRGPRRRCWRMHAGLMHWRQRHKFCGVCGSICEIKSSGHMMQCTACESQHFPRTDPAVIMLVHRGDRAVLGLRPVPARDDVTPRSRASSNPAKPWRSGAARGARGVRA